MSLGPGKGGHVDVDPIDSQAVAVAPNSDRSLEIRGRAACCVLAGRFEALSDVLGAAAPDFKGPFDGAGLTELGRPVLDVTKPDPFAL